MAHPQVPRGPQTLERDGVFVTVSYVRPEEADWNKWPEDGFRLFNNRMGHLFEVHSNLPQEAKLSADRTRLELNSPDHLLMVATSPDRFLDPLINVALMEQRRGGDSGLVSRLRGAGEFRSSWLAYRGEQWEGLVGFPVGGDVSETDAVPRSELHIVAMRLTLAFEVDNGLQEWVFVLD